MRKIILSLSTSLDSYLARRNGNVDFLSMPREYSIASFFASVDTAIMGRKTLEAGLKMNGGSLPASSMPYYVFSRSKPPGKSDGWTFVNESPAAFVAKLRKRPGKHIWLMAAANSLATF
jgi:dihydrofolate reductase